MWGIVCLSLAATARAEPNLPLPIRAVLYSPDGAEAIIARGNQIEVGPPGEPPARVITTNVPAIHALCLSPNGQELAVAGGRAGVTGILEFRQWPSGTLRCRTELHDDVIYSAAYLRDGAALITGSFDATVGRVSLPAGELQATWEGHSKGVLAVAAADDGMLVTAGIDEALRVRNAQGEVLRTMPQHRGTVHDLAWQPTNAEAPPGLLASAGGDQTVRFWQPPRGRLVRFARLPAIPLALAWVPGTQEVLVACEDGHIRGLDAGTVGITRDWSLYAEPALSLAVHPHGTHALVGSARGEVRHIPLANEPQPTLRSGSD